MSASPLTVDYNFASPSPVATPKDYWQLLKPGVMALVVFTGAVGLLVAPNDANLSLYQCIIALLCIALGSGAGAAFNMWYDADIDAVMHRTQKRAIPSGKIAAPDVLVLSLFTAILSVGLLGLTTNWNAAALLAFAIWFYGCFYTMILKRKTPQNIVIGGAAGAFPPVIGWMCATPMLTWEPLIYFLIVFLWTPPHFWALALYRHDDYKRANVPMLPVSHGETSTLRHIMFYSLLLIASTMLPTILDMRGMIYTGTASLLGSIFMYKAYRLWRNPGDTKAIRLFAYSIFYLFILFFSVIIDSLVYL